jgi:molecular chaperone DnaK
VGQAERRLRDAALELGPYGAERQQRAVEIAMRDVQEMLADGDLSELDISVSQLQEAIYGLNRRLASERKQDSNPIQGIKNTLGSLKDELFAEDDWDDWDRPGRSRDPWSEPRLGGGWQEDRWDRPSLDRFDAPRPRWDRSIEAPPRWDQSPQPRNQPWDEPADRYGRSEREFEPAPRYGEFDRYPDRDDARYDDRYEEGVDQLREARVVERDNAPRPRTATPATPDHGSYEGDPWAED